MRVGILIHAYGYTLPSSWTSQSILHDIQDTNRTYRSRAILQHFAEYTMDTVNAAITASTTYESCHEIGWCIPSGTIPQPSRLMKMLRCRIQEDDLPIIITPMPFDYDERDVETAVKFLHGRFSRIIVFDMSELSDENGKGVIWSSLYKGLDRVMTYGTVHYFSMKDALGEQMRVSGGFPPRSNSPCRIEDEDARPMFEIEHYNTL